MAAIRPPKNLYDFLVYRYRYRLFIRSIQYFFKHHKLMSTAGMFHSPGIKAHPHILQFSITDAETVTGDLRENNEGQKHASISYLTIFLCVRNK